MNHLSTLKKLLLAIACVFGTAAGAEVKVELSGMIKEAVVGEALGFSIDVTLDDPDTTADFSSLKLNGKPLLYELSELGTSSARVVINGRVVKDNTGSRRRYTFRIPSDQPGRYVVPDAVVTIGDQKVTVPQMDFTVSKPPTSADLLFRTELLRPQPSYYPTQVIEVLCKLYYRNLQNVERDSIALPIVDDDRLQLLPDEKTESVLVINQRKIPVTVKQSQNELFNGKRYQTFAFVLRFRVLEPGQMSFNNVFKVSHDSGEYNLARDFFGRRVGQPVRKTLYGMDTLELVVKDLPKDAVPATFNGAIGAFQLTAIPSTDTDVRVGDPITLSLEVRGNGTCELIQCPPVNRVQALTDYFKVPEDLPVGDVAADGTSKTFKVRMRVKSQAIKQIPPIPFTYFDIDSESYKTTYSEPVPITVYDGGRTAQIVDFTQTQEAPETDSPVTATAESIDTSTTALSDESADDGPQKAAPIRIGNNAATALLQLNHAPAYSRLLIPAGAFLLALITWIVRTVSQTAPSPEKLRKLRSKQAYTTFRSATKDLNPAAMESRDFYREIGRAVRTFVCDRFMTNEDLDAQSAGKLKAAGRLTADQATALLQLIEAIDQQRYSSEDIDTVTAQSTLEQAREVLKSC